jgi:hypothetical protein
VWEFGWCGIRRQKSTVLMSVQLNLCLMRIPNDGDLFVPTSVIDDTATQSHSPHAPMRSRPSLQLTKHKPARSLDTAHRPDPLARSERTVRRSADRRSAPAHPVSSASARESHRGTPRQPLQGRARGKAVDASDTPYTARARSHQKTTRKTVQLEH